MKPVRLHIPVVLFILLIYSGLVARQDSVTVPDLTGLNIPQAAAVLNRNGLALGEESNGLWTEAAGIPQNTIGQQMPGAGEVVAAGTSVDVVLLRSPNVTLVYDDNDLTLINRDNRRIDFDTLVFNALHGSREAVFRASRWAGRVRGGYCTQIWSIGRTSPKDIPGCQSIERWLTTNNPTEHFWTAVNGIQSFNVVQDEVERAICEAAPVGSESRTCEFYLDVAGGSDSTDFVYFAYTEDKFIIRNRSENQWMRLNRSIIHNSNPINDTFGSSFELGNPDLFGNPEMVARIQRLAPGQCLLFKKVGTDAILPEACDVIATLEVPGEQAFWTFDFELQSVNDNKRRLCRAAVEGKLTICVMPR
jgi:hypothetical protein